MIRITHPAPVAGESEASGLTFVDGVAEVEAISDEAVAVLKEHGFKFEDTETPAQRKAREEAEAKAAAEKEAAEKAEREKREADEKAAAEAEAARLAAEKEAAEKAAAEAAKTKAPADKK